MASVSVSTPFNIDLEFEIAAFHKRLLAWVIDLGVLLFYANGMKFFVLDNLFFKGDKYPVGIDLVIISIPLLLYPVVMEAVFQGQSLGKKIVKVRVISLEGGEPDIGQYIIRWIFRFWEWPLVFGFVAIAGWSLVAQIFVVLMLGVFVVIIIAISPKSQRLGDMAAGTTVVDITHHFTLADTVFQHVAPVNYVPKYPEVMRLSDRDINAIKGVITQLQRTGKYDTAYRIADKIKAVLNISSDQDVSDFLETLMADYNYLATKE